MLTQQFLVFCYLLLIINPCFSPRLSLSEFSRYSSAVMGSPFTSKSKEKSLSVHTKSGKKLIKSAESSSPLALGEDFALIRSDSSVTQLSSKLRKTSRKEQCLPSHLSSIYLKPSFHLIFNPCQFFNGYIGSFPYP